MAAGRPDLDHRDRAGVRAEPVSVPSWPRERERRSNQVAGEQRFPNGDCDRLLAVAARGLSASARVGRHARCDWVNWLARLRTWRTRYQATPWTASWPCSGVGDSHSLCCAFPRAPGAVQVSFDSCRADVQQPAESLGLVRCLAPQPSVPPATAPQRASPSVGLPEGLRMLMQKAGVGSRGPCGSLAICADGSSIRSVLRPEWNVRLNEI